MPDPKSVFTAFKTDLEAAGITINETSKPWNGGYIDGVDGALPDLFLFGWNGDYNTPDNFIGTFFTSTTNRFSTGVSPWGATLSADLSAADSIPDDAARTAAYTKLNQQIMGEYLPSVPISYSPSALVLAADVQGLVASPLSDEEFSTAYKN
jgi:peptide/nickel transport system substrate-binding protein